MLQSRVGCEAGKLFTAEFGEKTAESAGTAKRTLQDLLIRCERRRDRRKDGRRGTMLPCRMDERGRPLPRKHRIPRQACPPTRASCPNTSLCRCFTSYLLFRFMFANNGGMAITRRQREVYDFISRFVAEHGYSPSFEEIGKGLELTSLATVHKHVTNLEKKGLLTRDYNRSRSIDLLPPKGRLKQAMSVNTGLVLPLMGRIAAGQPIEAVENPETISLADFVRSKDVFVLEVRGDSMQDEAILDGDYVLVEKARTAHNGDIVVALVDQSDATLKRFYREGESIRLQPSNVTMKPIIVPAASVDVQGRVIGVLRKY
jgi:repressor LexA